ncbi:ABC transporter permease [Methanocella arvoryzae]|uniref:ABC-type transport system, permease component n=1 Tax=Methanocella arvoryzae (strain DSM 22066 / NBRC 105507 / MRE50) TaxID=351160 RepID=Q0W4K9_METAR|nr:ABC transporter permease subunit [Methanocella arvoryzae]CAJ36684.1 hypothetical protein RCIX1416 [Methanocella arvoryzae MRE50]
MRELSKGMILIACNEISRLFSSPIVIVFAALMVILSFTNAAGVSVVLPTRFSFLDHDEAFFYVGLGNFLWNMSALFSFLSICIGIVSFTDEKKGSLRLLLTKPVYRRDAIIGKYLGIMVFLLLMITLTVCLFVSLTMIVFGGPESAIELVLRAGSFILLLFLNCGFTIGLVTFFCIILSKAEAMMASIAFIAMEYLARMPWVPSSLGELQIINPVNLYIAAFAISPGKDLYSLALPYSTWLDHALPYLLLMITEIIVILLINSILLSREEL